MLDDGLDKPDGVQQYILTLGTWYSAHGHEVHYLVGETKRTDLPNVHSLAKNVGVTFNGNRLTIPLPASKKGIKRVLKAEEFDVLHVQVPYSPFMGAKVIMAAPKETAVVGTFHILPYGVLSRVGTRLLGIWLYRSLRRFNKHISVSKPAAEFATKTFKIKSEIVPNSIPIARFQPTFAVNHSDELFRILFLGRLVQRKGCHRLLQSLARLKRQHKLPDNVHVDICGDGAMRGLLEAYVKRHDLSDIVTFHGFISEDQKIDFMQHADIAVFPSLSGESFGIVLIEAMAAGSGVVLGGNNPGYASVLADIPGALVDASRPSIFAKQLHEIMTNAELRSRIHAAQQQHVSQFDTTVVAQRLLHMYELARSE